MTKEAMKLALEALEGLNNTNSHWWQEVDEQTIRKIEPAITAIKEALAQPERTWGGLTDEEVEKIFHLRKGIYPTIHEVEAKSRRKIHD